MKEIMDRNARTSLSTHLTWIQNSGDRGWTAQRNATILFYLDPLQNWDEEGRTVVLTTTLPGGQLYAQPCMDLVHAKRLADDYLSQWASGMEMKIERRRLNGRD